MNGRVICHLEACDVGCTGGDPTALSIQKTLSNTMLRRGRHTHTCMYAWLIMVTGLHTVFIVLYHEMPWHAVTLHTCRNTFQGISHGIP